MNCARCGAPAREGGGFCSACGSRLAEMPAPSRPVKVIRLDRVPVQVPDYLRANLDDEQLDAVLHAEGHCLILAGAGCGKTRTLTYKLAHLVASGVPPENILMVTFTRRAAREMVARAQAASGSDLSGMLAGTFHHVAHMLLRRHAPAIGLQTSFSIIDEDDAVILARMARREVAATLPAETRDQVPRASVMKRAFDLSVDTCRPLGQVVREDFPYLSPFAESILSTHEVYTQKKRAQNLLDYSDLLLFAVRLLHESPTTEARLAERFRWVLVDEFQDTNRLQAEMVERLASHHRNLLVVGDDSQSIYSFRGADYQNILEFGARPDTHVYKIQTNYRATPRLIAFTNSCIPNNVFAKELRAARRLEGELPAIVRCQDARDEAVFVAQKVAELVNEERVLASEIAVLFRSASHSADLQVELARRGIFFDVRAGQRITETAHVKDVLALLRICANPQDQIAWFRALQLCRGVGHATATQVFEAVAAQEDPLAHFLHMEFPRAGQALERLRGTVRELLAVQQPAEMLRVAVETFYREYLRREFPNAREREDELESLTQVAERYRSLESFLSDLLLVERIGFDWGGRGEVPIVLSTVHQAKGLEWSVVFVLAVTPGQFPWLYARDQKEIDEERRVFYVAITRAKDNLFLCRPEIWQGGYHASTWVYTGPDFLAEVPPALVEEWRVE